MRAAYGKRVHRKYKSAYEKKDLVTDALRKRVQKGKTVKLGEFHGGTADLPGDAGLVVPNGSVAKKLEPDAVRKFSDHTKTGLNAACDMSLVQHTLDTYNEIARAIRPGYFMRVEDVDGAFPILPLHPKVWKCMYVWWFDVDRPLEEQEGRRHIHELEGDAVLRAAKALAGRWKHKRVPFFIDNTAFQLSFKKGRSKAPELNTILRQLFLISSKYDCLFVPQWISTKDNICADALSRGKLQRFFAAANEFSSTCQRLQGCGE